VYLDSPKVPVVLLPFATLVFVTTATCIFDFMHWDVPLQNKIDLTTLYGPYLALSKFFQRFAYGFCSFHTEHCPNFLGAAGFMLVDMIIRLNGVVDRATGAVVTKKAQ